MATIREKGYSHWDGTLRESRFPWWPITRTGIRLTFRKKQFKFFFAFAFVPAIVFLVGIYISERLEDFKFMFKGSEKFITVNPAYFKTYFTSDFLLFMMVMLLVFAGAGPHRRRPEAQRPPALFRPAPREEGLSAGQGRGRLLLHPAPDARSRAPLHRLQAHLLRELPVPGRVSLAPVCPSSAIRPC